MNAEQQRAVEATGEVFVSAGAGTGKTTVLVERFVRAVCDAGLDVESVLVITYTRKAAGELRARIRAALHARGRPDLARRLDGAWISTIHGFCSRLLRTHPFAVGLDPRFHELADDQAAVLRGEAFERALAAFCASRDPERLRLLATYGAQGLRKMLTGVYETLRSAGRDLTLELGERAGVAERLAELQEAARALAADADATDKQLAAANVALALGSNPEQLLDLSELAAAGDRAAEFRAARDRLQQAALEELAARDSELLQELLNLFAAEYQVVEAARVGARLRGPAALRARPAARPRADPRRRAAAVPLDHGRRVPGHEPPAVPGRRPAARRARRDGRLLRRRRVPVDLRLPARRRGRLPRAARGGGAAAAARAQLPLAARGARRRQPPLPARSSATGYQALAASGSSPIPCSAIRSSCSSPTRRAIAKPARRGARARRTRSRGACASSSTRAPLPPARSCCSSPPAPTRSATRRRCARQGLPTYRATGPRLLRPAAGGRPARRTCGCCTTATTTRRSQRCSRRRSSASRTTRSC